MDTTARASVLVVGGGYAGVMAAIRAARRLGGRGTVVLVSERDALVERIRLHESAASGRDPARPLSGLLRGTGVRLVHARADAIDVEARTVLAGGERIAFERLILALGSRVDVGPIPGAREHAAVLEPGTVSALEERSRDAARRGGHALVIGGGLTGIEGAAELAERHPGLRVTLVTSGELGHGLVPRAKDHVRASLARLGVVLREHTRVTRVDAHEVVLEGERVPFDVCVAAGGFAAPEVLRAWGLPVDARGRARVDARLRLEGAPHVYVAGDCAAPEGVLGSPIPTGCKSAMPMGVHAAENAVASLEGRPERALDWIETVYCLSLGRRDGLLQAMHADGTPRGLFIAGRAGAILKEMICRFTVRSMEWERDGLFEYRFPRASRRALAALAATSSEAA